MKTLISVIIPNYNCEQYLAKCLDSVINQTLKQIEVIVIDDCSIDGSVDIINRYCESDSRINFIKYSTNKSQSQARKDGVLASKGEYIMFLDSDDYLMENACERLYNKIKEDSSDILCFGTNVIRENPNIAQNRYESLQKWLNNFGSEKYSNPEIFDSCFSKRTLPFTLWNKIYKSDICKAGFSEVSDGYFPKGQDVYAFFCVAKHAKSLTTFNEQFYNYRFGSGVAGSTTLNLEQFKKISLQGKIISELRKKNGEQSEFFKYISELETSLCKEITAKWCNQVGPEESGKAFEYLLSNFSPAAVIKLLIEKYLYKQGELARRVYCDSSLLHEKINARTLLVKPHIGIFYHRASFGGVQRVINDQVRFLLDQGYTLTLFLEEKLDAANGYNIDKRVNICYVDKSTPYNKNNAELHLKTFDKILSEVKPKIDLMIYHAGSSANLIWDLILLKAYKVKSIVIHHESFAYYMMQPMNYGIDRHDVFRLSDLLVVLTKAAQTYYSCYGIRSLFIPNQVPLIKEGHLASYRQNKILCVGRLDDSVKQYYETLRVIVLIKKQCPDVKLHLVGSFNSKTNESNFIEFAKKNGIYSNLVFEGAHSDVGPFYESSTCLLVTSLSEGFSLVIAEAKARGLPIITYDLPYLDLVRDNLGVIRVEHGNADAAAAAFLKLNNDRELWELKHAECLTSISKFIAVDIAKKWDSAIKDVISERPIETSVDYESVQVIERSLLFSHTQLVKKYKQLESKSKITNKVVQVVEKKCPNKVLGFLNNIKRKLFK